MTDFDSDLTGSRRTPRIQHSYADHKVNRIHSNKEAQAQASASRTNIFILSWVAHFSVNIEKRSSHQQNNKSHQTLHITFPSILKQLIKPFLLSNHDQTRLGHIGSIPDFVNKNSMSPQFRSSKRNQTSNFYYTCICKYVIRYMHTYTLHYIALHCIALRYITLHYTTLHCIALH